MNINQPNYINHGFKLCNTNNFNTCDITTYNTLFLYAVVAYPRPAKVFKTEGISTLSVETKFTNLDLKHNELSTPIYIYKKDACFILE